MWRVFPAAVPHGRRGECSAQGDAPCSFISIEQGFCVSLTHLPRPCSGSIDAAAGRQERLHRGRRELEQPRARGQPVAEPHDFAQPIRHVSGEALLLLG